MLEIRNKETSRAPAQANQTPLSSPAPNRHWFGTGTAQALGALPLGAPLPKTWQLYTDMIEITEPFSSEVCPSVPPVKGWEKLLKHHRECKFPARTTPALIHPAHGPTSLFLSLILQDCRLPRAESLPAHALAGTKGRMSSIKAVSSFLTFHKNLGERMCSSSQNPKLQQHISAFPPPPPRAHCREAPLPFDT